MERMKMKTYKLKIELLSPTLIGSGEGYGAVIDTDVVYDDYGTPIIPAKRIKGCLLDSAKEIRDMFTNANIEINLKIEQTFGIPGQDDNAPVYFSNLSIEEYENNQKWLAYFLSKKEYQDFISKEKILETYTETRQQTAIDTNGVAFDHSLRTIRVINKGCTFFGDIHIESDDDEIVQLIHLACLNLHNLGTKRNRGFGEVRCTLCNGTNEFVIDKKLEEICTN